MMKMENGVKTNEPVSMTKDKFLKDLKERVPNLTQNELNYALNRFNKNENVEYVGLDILFERYWSDF